MKNRDDGVGLIVDTQSSTFCFVVYGVEGSKRGSVREGAETNVLARLLEWRVNTSK